MAGIDPYDPNNPYNLMEKAKWEAENPQPPSAPTSWIGDLLVFAFALVFLFIYIGVSRFFSIPSVKQYLGTYWSRGLLVLAVAAAGYTAFRFKRGRQIWYGRVEVAFGVASCIKVALTSPIQDSLLVQWSALIGCIYVISRGFNNISDARLNQKPGAHA